MDNTFFKKENRLNDVVIIRSIAIIMVVAFHAYSMMMAKGHFFDSSDIYRGMYYNINCLILQFRMPLFITISGYLFSYLEKEKGKYNTFRGLCTNKLKRLILPLIIFLTIFMLTTNDFSWKTYLVMGWQHLWFISMLFWCFILTRIISVIPISSKSYFIFSCLIIFFILRVYKFKLPPLLGIQYLPSWYFWFYFGYQLYAVREKIFSRFFKHKISYSLILTGIFTFAAIYKCVIIGNDDTVTWQILFGDIAIVLLIWFWINYLLYKGHISKEGKVLKRFNWLNQHSYGIFVFHNWLQPFMISSTAISLFGLDVLAMKYTILFPFIFFITSFFLSLSVTWLLLRTKIGKFLIG